MIQEQNKMIALFEGWHESPYPHLPNRVYKTDPDGEQVGVSISALSYHSDWNEFMRIYRKCKDFLQNMERPSRNHCCKGDLIEVDVNCAVMEINIKDAHKHLVHLIEWINAHQNPLA